MLQLILAKKEIALGQIEETNPLKSHRGANYRECTKENPMPKGLENISRWQHPEDMVHETDYDSDYYIEYKCDLCGYKWKSEMPQ